MLLLPCSARFCFRRLRNFSQLLAADKCFVRIRKHASELKLPDILPHALGIRSGKTQEVTPDIRKP